LQRNSGVHTRYPVVRYVSVKYGTETVIIQLAFSSGVHTV